MSELVYLASPYSHPDPSVRLARFEAACRAAGELMRRGQLVFSPIAHSHPIACCCDLPKGWDFWERYDRVMLDACGRLVVLCLDGWQQSVGVRAEIEIMRAAGKPVEYIPEPELTTATPLAGPPGEGEAA
jgi:hypothetical protein